MAVHIAIALQKGGTSKTTTATNLAANLTAAGKKVLLVDMDTQANSTFASGIDSYDLDYSLYNVLTSNDAYKCRIEDAIIKTPFYDLVAADKDVAELSGENISPMRFKTVLVPLDGLYDYIIFDTPPSLGIITINALAAARHVIVPIEPKPFNFTGMRDLEHTINEVKERYNPKLNILGILLVKCSRTNIAKQITELIKQEAERLQTTCFDTTIREGVAVVESQLMQQPLLKYAPVSKPSMDYKDLTAEVLTRIEER